MDSWVSLWLTEMMYWCSSGVRFWPSLNAWFCVAGNPGYSLPMRALNDKVCFTYLLLVISNLTRFYRNVKLFKIQAGFRWYCFPEWRLWFESSSVSFSLVSCWYRTTKVLTEQLKWLFFHKWVSFLPFLPFASPPWQILLFEISVVLCFINLKSGYYKY